MATNRNRITFFQMLRDILVASLVRGQFPMAVMGMIAIIAVCRMPPEDLSRLIFRLLHASEAGEYGGYLLAIVIALSWAVHVRRLRDEMAREIKRLNEERDRLQQMVHKIDIKSSGRRK